MSTTYKARPGSSAWTGGIAPQVIGEELERIRVKDGGELRTAAVVDAARPEAAPLHPAFEWDDEAAAEEWRLHQARNLVRSVVIINRNEAGEEERAPAFVNIRVAAPDPQEGEEAAGPRNYYQATAEALKRPDEWQAAINAAASRVHLAKQDLTALMRFAEAKGPDSVALLSMITQALATAEAGIKQMKTH